MKIRGKRISNWWLLLLAPLLIAAFPGLLLGFFMANNLAGAILGPPAIWNRPWHTPDPLDVVGSYSESKRRLDTQSNFPAARLTLTADGSMTVAYLPVDEFGKATCFLSGIGIWNGPNGNDPEMITVNLRSDNSPGSCKSGPYQSLELASHSKPYDLYWIVGDPDSGTGVWLKSEK